MYLCKLHSTAMIDVQKLKFSYSQKHLLDGLSFELDKGDFCAIVGPNGSGKTTLLKLMTGLLQPQGGSVQVGGQPLNSLSAMEKARLMAYVAQRQDVVFDFSVFDTVLMGRNPHQSRWETASSHDVQVVEEVLQLTGLADYRNRMLTELSGGEVQRVMIARAMAQQTPVILLDEPLSNLDITYQFEVMDILQHLNKQNDTTIVIILHDLSFVKKYAHKVLMLQNGTLKHFGPVDDVLTEPNVREVFHLSSHYGLDANGHVYRTSPHP